MDQSRDLLEFVERIYDTALDPLAWDRLLPDLERAMRANASALFMQTPGAGDYRFLFAHGFCDSYLENYENVSDRNPWLEVPGLMRPGRILTDSCLDDIYRRRDQFVQGPFYYDWCRLQDFRHVVGGSLLSHGKYLLNFTFMRSRDQGPFSPTDIARHAFIARHLSKAVGIQQRIEAIRDEAAASNALLDRLALGVMFIGRNGSLCACNRAAEDILRQADGLGLAAGVVHAMLPREDAALKALVRGVTSPHHHHAEIPDLVIVSRPSGKMAYSVTGFPVPASALSGITPARCEGILLVSDPERGSCLSGRHLKARFGFTDAEARLAIALEEHSSLPVAARVTGTAYETARWHLKAMYQKAGVNSQPALIRLLLTDLAASVAAQPARGGHSFLN